MSKKKKKQKGKVSFKKIAKKDAKEENIEPVKMTKQEKEIEQDQVIEAKTNFVKKELSQEKKTLKPDSQKETDVELGLDDDLVKLSEVNGDHVAGEQNIEEKLIEIYENTDGSMPDMKAFKQRKGGKFWKAFLVFLFSCAFLATVAWVGLFVLQDRAQFSEEDVVLSISGDEEVSVGEEVTYRLRYRNDQNIDLERVILEVRYPNGFVFASSSLAASNERNDSWDLGTLESQESGFIDITGRVFGDLDSKQSLRVFLNYTPANFSSEFQKVAYVALTVKESPVDLEIEALSEVATGLDTPIVVTIRPRDNKKIENIALVCELDGGFNLNSSKPEMDEMEDCQWSFDELTQEQTVTLSGSFNANEGNKGKLIIKVLGWDLAKKEGDGYVLASKTVEVQLLETNVTLSLAVNGSMGKMNVSPGEILTTSIVLKNSGESVIEDGVIRMIWDTPSYNDRSILNWLKIDTEHDADISGEQINEDLRRGNITWDKRYIPRLGRIEPGDEIRIDFRLPVKSSGDILLSDFKTFEIKGMTELQYDQDGKHEILTSNELTFKVQSDLDLEVRDEVSQDDAGRNIHTVTWLLSNSFHELSHITVEADIYGDFELNKDNMVVPAGEVEFNPDTKRLTWIIDQMPTIVDVLAMQFEIILNSSNPTQTDLTSKVEVRAEDTLIGENIIVVGDEILLSY